MTAKERIAEIDEELQRQREIRRQLLEERAKLEGPVQVSPSKLTIPAITSEQLYLQDKRRRERDVEDRRWAYYHLHGVYPRWMQ